MSTIRPLLAFSYDWLVEIWEAVARAEGTGAISRPYDAASDAMDPSDTEVVKTDFTGCGRTGRKPTTRTSGRKSGAHFTISRRALTNRGGRRKSNSCCIDELSRFGRKGLASTIRRWRRPSTSSEWPFARRVRRWTPISRVDKFSRFRWKSWLSTPLRT